MIRKSPMGWNSWDCYGPSVDEKTVRANAEVMADKLKSCGWEYVVVDIQWYQPSASSHDYDPFADLVMDEYGRLLPAENRFPSAAGGKGFAPLAEYVHSLGLKFGIHIMRGIPRQAVHRNTPVLGSDRTARQVAKTNSICAWNTDMYGVDPKKEGARAYYESIFRLYAEWGIDFIKCDDICRELPHEEEELLLLSDCVKNCGREMVLSLSPGPALLEKAQLYKQCANMWRITDDFWDRWDLLYAMFERCEKWSVHTGEGNYPDADMLPVGAILQNADPENRTRFTRDEQETMMMLWSIFRSPLMIGGDLTKLDDFTEKLLTNRQILAMHEDARHAHQVWRREINGRETVLWTALSARGGQYAAVFNLSDEESAVEIPISDLEPAKAPENLLDLWSGESRPQVEVISAKLPAHGAAAFLMT
ncbi:MAG: glycoside hydrolase family 27 protein [Lachnospiraceae bacterium]|nr:glycoside hydrolase family 27 protein [Lachnospiraceae bacterium]